MHTALPLTHGPRGFAPSRALLLPILGAFTLAASAIAGTPSALLAQACERTVTANVVALDQAIWYNRLGAHDPVSMIFALREDVVPKLGTSLAPGAVQLRVGKRPRPLTLRMNAGDCLQVSFQNLLAPVRLDPEQPATRTAGLAAIGLHAVGGIASMGQNVGTNASSLVAPGNTATYTFYAEREGQHLLYSPAANTGGEGDGGQIARGLFGSVNVEPKGAVWYRSQVTADDLELATARDAAGAPVRTPSGHPVVDYSARYPVGHPLAGRPILTVLDGNRIAHSDLTAIIAGPNGGQFSPASFTTVTPSPDRFKPFREFTVIFHDEIGIVQAFDAFTDPLLAYTLTGGRDGFAINYGTGGVGAEVIANRAGVGPMGDCPECKLEEFFLQSWAVGDPAMVVDVPANTKDAAGKLILGKKATKAYFPDDPSNVMHSYIGDHVKFRNLHAGPKEHHIFHLHAHQWLGTPDEDKSSYKDSQGIGPGASYTYEITYGGSGNRNQTVGDAIFHCHFYPHFAQGMWALWRSHDVFESGTKFDADGIPVPGTRALPDGEIAAGTPIPALVPLPGYAMAPLPGTDDNPGFPFFIAGEKGHRSPKPPLDTPFDGGLPRHVVIGGTAEAPPLNTTDFHKVSLTLNVRELPETGTLSERAAMAYHSKRSHPTFSVDPLTMTVRPDSFRTNGMPAVAGAPFADPCVNDQGVVAGVPRTYKAAAFQMDVKYTKNGWHNPQHRMFGLWEDVQAFLNGTKAPEPMFMRVNTNDCVDYRLVNLVPANYEMDDFEVTSPTDVLGQHIHLVKFDVTSSDGASNGFNYEDGALAPGEVVERIRAIRRFNTCTGLDSGDARDNSFTCPVAKAHPFFGAGPNGSWIGAQENVQRWYVDALKDVSGNDRTLKSVFTHDHFGPSTHQQTGLYAGLIAEPKNSQWRDSEKGTLMNTRADGGPTSFRADILTAIPDSSFREFNLMFQDFALAYRAEKTGIGPSPALAVNPAGKFEGNIRNQLLPPVEGKCPNGTPAPCPEIVSVDDPGIMTVNYRSEPIPLRIRWPSTNSQAPGLPGDLSYVFSSRVKRVDPIFNTQPTFYPALTGGVGGQDPFTPLFRAYEGDRVQVRLLAGAHEEGHNLSVHGLKWKFEQDDPNSGYRNSQFMGLSEHFELVMPPLPGNITATFADYMYQMGSSTDDLWSGAWGLMRAYRNKQQDLLFLPSNPTLGDKITNIADFNGVCPVSAPLKQFNVSVVTAKSALPGGALIYNPRAGTGGALRDSTAIMYVHSSDVDASGKLKPGVPIEPLVLRVNAGDCIDVTLNNTLPLIPPDAPGWFTLPMLIPHFNSNDLRVSSFVGLHPQLLALDVTRSDGAEFGGNNGGYSQLVAPGKTTTKPYRWYAGEISVDKANYMTATPIEFGATNLIPSDPIKHGNKGAVGALIVEPKGATWREDATTRTSATVTKIDGTTFREFVLVFQDNINLSNDNGPIPLTAGEEDPEDSGQQAFNYRTEPMWKRMGYTAETPLGVTGGLDFTNVLSNTQVNGDPVTPVFTAKAGDAVRFRVLHPAGHQRNHVIAVSGHSWREMPYVKNSLEIGDNPTSESRGSQTGIGPTSHFNMLLERGAGGAFKVPGDYLIRDFQSFQFDGGLWGILRVTP